MDNKKLTVSIGGKDISFETGKIARQANGSVLLTSGETMILTTACASFAPTTVDFLPLRVDYFEKFSSAGKTLGGFIKREGRPTEKTTLVCRLIDRPLRPMFEEGYYHETQILSSVLSYDGIHSPEPLAICGASAALVISDIPLIKPIGAVRVGMIDDTLIINPSVEEQEKSRLDLILAGTEDAILMTEGYCDFLTEEQLLEAVEEGHKSIQTICKGLSDWQKLIGKDKVRDGLRILPETLTSEMHILVAEPVKAAMEIQEKQKREDALSVINTTVMDKYFPEGQDAKYTDFEVKSVLKKVSAHYMRQMILQTNKRCDGRSPNDVRPINIELDLLPRTHGSTLFTRGETQSISVCTLGSESMGQRFETLNGDGTSRFYLQYSFPPFCVGEVGRVGPAGRREVGHGKLAERALLATVPAKEDFPYTIRLEANITESNGSSSMAAICGGCLSMMAGGVPIKRPIAGIAMGLILEKEKYAILSDILGVEDALGDMDFKIAGDTRGITAFQLDIKVEGITHKIMQVALAQAKEGRIHILSKMLEACPSSHEKLSKHVPKIVAIKIKPSKIAIVIGPGGKQIRAIIEETGVDIDIDDDGIVNIVSTDQESIDKAREIIHNLTADVEIGATYTGKVVSIKDFGMFVEIFSKQGLCHISEID
ncbi:MAG: polyribonucleotide nucleotidyltransferase, partial [Simkaniaceae bacterium]|nr:polyribonucleotide nucleotidyltransferase [Simkaniaceae bacterium]